MSAYSVIEDASDAFRVYRTPDNKGVFSNVNQGFRSVRTGSDPKDPKNRHKNKQTKHSLKFVYIIKPE